MINPTHSVLIQTAVAYILDIALGDPQWTYHPVRLIGKFIENMEGLVWRFPVKVRIRGIALTTIIVFGTYLSTYSVIFIAKKGGISFEMLSGAVIIYFTISIKTLADEAKKVMISLRENDLIKARHALSQIVGRDTDRLSEEQIVRACVETVAEGGVDSIVSPLFYSFVGGPVAAMVYRAINTLDSMVGYRNEKYIRFGWASARLDDIANYIPARICAVLIPAASFLCGCGFTRSLRIAFRDGRKHESPNSGIPEAAMAGALGVQIGGPGTYQGEIVEKPFIGDAHNPLTMKSIDTAIKIIYIASVLFMACGIGLTVCLKYCFSLIASVPC